MRNVALDLGSKVIAFCDVADGAEHGSGTREVVQEALASASIAVNVAMRGSTEAIENAVAGGLGVAFVSTLTIALERASGRLAIIELPDLTIRRPLHLLRLKGKPLSPAALEFLRVLRGRYPHSANGSVPGGFEASDCAREEDAPGEGVRGGRRLQASSSRRLLGLREVAPRARSSAGNGGGTRVPEEPPPPANEPPPAEEPEAP